MQTLPYGYKKPDTGDKGQSLFTALEENIQLTNDHTHDGTNSARLTTSAITKYTQNVSKNDWANEVDGMFSQVVSITNGLEFDSVTITVRSNTGKALNLHYEKVDTSQFRIYCNDSTLDVVIVYA